MVALFWTLIHRARLQNVRSLNLHGRVMVCAKYVLANKFTFFLFHIDWKSMYCHYFAMNSCCNSGVIIHIHCTFNFCKPKSNLRIKMQCHRLLIKTAAKWCILHTESVYIGVSFVYGIVFVETNTHRNFPVSYCLGVRIVFYICKDLTADRNTPSRSSNFE